MTAWDEVRAACIADAKTFLNARKDAEVLRDHVVAWINTARDEEDIAALPTGTDDLARAFRAAGLLDLAEYARAPSGGEGPIPTERWLFAALLGRACAVDFSFGLNTGKWRDPHFWGLESYGAWDAYLAELIAILSSSERSQESFWAAVSAVIDTMASDPGAFTWGRAEEKNGVRVAVDEYRTQPSINEAWETRLDSQVWPERAFIFGLARQLDAARLFDLAERLPHPVFLRFGIGDASAVSEHEIARLLTLAPPAFDPAGIFQSAGMIAVHLLKKASGRLRWLAGHGRVYDAPHSAEDEARIASDIDNATAGLNGILDALFARPDAKFLGWAWLERLVYEGERRGHWRPGHHTGRGGYVDTWLIVVRGLAQRLGPRSDAVPWVLSREYLWRSDRVTAALAAALFVEPSNGTALKSLLRALLTSVEPPYPGAAETMSRMDAPLPKIGGHCILTLDEPAAFLTSTWQDLRPYRERAWRAHTRADQSGNVAEILVLWAMQAIEVAPFESARLLMQTLEAVLCDAFQTDAQIGMREFWLAAVERFGRRIGKACPVNPDEIHSHVRDFIWPYLRDEEYVVRISMALHEGGIKAPIITDALKSLDFDLTKAVIELVEINDKAGMRRRHNSIWLKNLEKAFCQSEILAYGIDTAAFRWTVDQISKRRAVKPNLGLSPFSNWTVKCFHNAGPELRSMTLTEVLQRFNRKERHWLVRDALGSVSRHLDRDFLRRVEIAVRQRDPNFRMKLGAWWATDYHIDWLVAALHVVRSETDATARQPNGHRQVTGNQQDIDLVVASDSTLILIEAKGVGSWVGQGLREKVERLRRLTNVVLDENGRAGPIQVHFLTCSPGDAPDTSKSEWPSWMTVNGQPLHVPMYVVAEAGPLYRVEQCDEAGTPNADGYFWHAVPDRQANKLLQINELDDRSQRGADLHASH